MKKYLFLLILVPTLLFSCNDESEKDFREYSIDGKLCGNEIIASMPSIICLDSLLVVYARDASKIIKIYSPKENMKEVASFGTRGRGPGEFFALELNSTHNNRFYGRNMNMQELVVFETVNDAGQVEVKEIERLKYERIFHGDTGSEDGKISYLDEEHFIGMSYGGHGKFFSLYDNRMNWLAHFGDLPIEEKVQPLNARQYLSGSLATNNGALVYSPLRLPKVVFYSRTDGAAVPQKQWEDTFYDSYYSVNNGLIGFDKSRTVGVVLNVALGAKYVYILFLDIPLADISMAKAATSAANIILVYDRMGNRVARLNLNYRLNDFCVSSDEKKVYGLTSTPEHFFVEFSLPKF